MKRLMLFGTPNCGKSSLFNLLTGRHAHVGNRAGVTVEVLSAPALLGGEKVLVSDLPGIRSLSPSSRDEQISRDALHDSPPDLLLFVCDATDFARSRVLWEDLFADRAARNDVYPVLAVFNFCDELERFPDVPALSRALGVPAAAVSARTLAGFGELKRTAAALLAGTAPAFCDPPLASRCPGDCAGCADAGCRSAEEKPHAAASFAWAERILGAVSRRASRLSGFADRVFLHPLSGFPVFFAVTFLMLYVVFGAPGDLVTDGFCAVFLSPLRALTRLAASRLPEWAGALLSVTLIDGVGAVVEFLPRLLLLFLLQSVAEQIGLPARFGRLWDAPLSRIGLRGDAVTPLLLGFGCTVPAVLCTRNMKDRRAAERCAGCLPLVTCSARMPLCRLFADAFFGGHGGLFCALVWVGSALVFLLFCAVSAAFSSHGRKITPIHDDALPRFRLPSVSETAASVLENLRHFCARAGGIILLSSLLVRLSACVSPRLVWLGDGCEDASLLAALARLIAPVFAPIGLNSWQAVAALLSGFGAKESTLSTLGVLLGSGNLPLARALAASGTFSRASALSFLVFYLFAFPCAASLATLRAERIPLSRLTPHLLFAYLGSLVAFWIAGGTF